MVSIASVVRRFFNLVTAKTSIRLGLERVGNLEVIIGNEPETNHQNQEVKPFL
jgi:hypothetical protein